MKNLLSKIRKGILIGTSVTLVGCSAFLPLKDMLIRHPSYEIYDDRDISEGDYFFSKSDNKLIMEGKSYPLKKDSKRIYPLNKEILEKIFKFIDNTVGVPGGTDIFTSRYDTEISGDAFYDKEWISKGGEIGIRNDRIYFEPLFDDPFTIKANPEGDFTASWTTSILQLYSESMHELAHEINTREGGRFNDLFENILKERNINVSEKGTPPIEYKTKISEAYANLYAVLVSLKFQHEEEQYIIDNHRFTFKDYEGDIIKENVKLDSLNLTPIIENYFYTKFSHKDVSCPYYFVASEEDKAKVRQKLENLKGREDEFLLPFYGVKS